MTNFVSSGRLASNAEFSQRVQGAIVAYAQDVRSEPIAKNADGSLDQVGVKRHSLAEQVLSDPSRYAVRFAAALSVDPSVSSAFETTESQAEVSDALISATVSDEWDATAGVRPDDTFSPTRDELASNPGFQRRVYQICSDLANTVVAASPYSGSDQALVDAEKIKRLFAVRFQAGKYVMQPYPLNFTTNVLSGSAIAGLENLNDITDEMIAARLAELVSLFVKGQLELTALGVDSGLLQ